MRIFFYIVTSGRSVLEGLYQVHINNVQLSQEEYVKYLGLLFERRLTWHKYIFVKRKQLGITLTKMHWLLWHKSKLPQATNFSYIKQYSTNLDLRNTTLWYGFHFQHRHSRAFPIKSLAHDNGLTLVYAEYGFQKGSPNTNNWKKNSTTEPLLFPPSSYSIVLKMLSRPRSRPTVSAGNRILVWVWICSHELWPLDHRGGRTF
jgi:hypothetical protein